MSEQLHELCKQIYRDPELAREVYEDAMSQELGDKLLSGELVLPHPIDARKWLDRKLGRDNETPSEREAHRKIRELEEKLQSMEHH